MRIVVSILLLAALADVVAADDNLMGFDTEGSAGQRSLEARFDEQLDAGELDAWLKRLSERPHHLGSAADRKVADFVAGLMRSWGYDTEIAEYRVMLPTPVTRELTLVAPDTYEAMLTEDSLPEDASTSVRDNLLPPYNAFSADGDVEGELVYVNYGTPEDYEILDRYGISVEGKIAIARYGHSWRGIKPKLAGEKGAIATIIYSDPADDGYAQGDTYPKGPYKHESGVQRGSVMDMPTYPGDILTPGRGATEKAERLKLGDAPTVTRIPVLPISAKDALPLLRAMDGAVVPEEWRGALPITYHFGPGPARVHLKLEFSWDMVTAYNVIARLEGSRFPDQWVIRGNHHDGWNHGAGDPLSGLVSMLAEAKAVATLSRSGRPPARTIIYAAWDAEEPGLIGSTEWAEDHAADLERHAVAYLNTDGNSRGFVGIGGSHTLEKFFNEIIDDVPDPQTGVTLKERLRAQMTVNAKTDEERSEAERPDLRIYPMGSGSDYSPFLQHLGIASANMGFGGEGEGGSYHTLYDTYEHYTTWRDPGMRYGVALSKVGGRATLRLANAPLLPFEFTAFADNVSSYVKEIEELIETMQKETDRRNKNLDEGLYRLALDPTKDFGPPPRQDAVPYMNLAPLKNALTQLTAAARAYEKAVDEDTDASRTVNELLYTSERLMTRDEGLDGRPWYKHFIYAPGFYTGYGVKTLPGVREAIEQREYADVGQRVDEVAAVLHRVAERIESLAELAGR